MKTFGERLAWYREERGWSQQELAEKAKVPYMTIYRLEANIYKDTRTFFAGKLARALGVSLDLLAGVYDDKERIHG